MASKLEQQSFLSGPNTAFIENLYARYLKDSSSVDPDWQAYFSGLEENATEALKEIEGASWAPRTTRDVPDE